MLLSEKSQTLQTTAMYHDCVVLCSYCASGLSNGHSCSHRPVAGLSSVLFTTMGNTAHRAVATWFQGIVLNIRRGIGLQRAHILRTFERARIRAILLAHAAFELLYRIVFVFFHPFGHFAFDHMNVFNAAAQEN